MSKMYWTVLCLMFSVASWAQSDSTMQTYELSDVLISRDVLRASEIGLDRMSVDSTVRDQHVGSSLAELFRTTAIGQMRSYGASGLTTPSFRGTSSSHTAVIWNGVNLQSPLSGQLDLSQMLVTTVDDISIQKGGSASLYGSGAIGGTIHVNNIPEFRKGLTLGTIQELGSFGNHFQNYGVNWSNKRFYNSTQVYSRELENDYSYTNVYVRPQTQEVRSNAGTHQYGLMQQNAIRVGDNNILGIKAWYNVNHLEIPESILAGGLSRASQNDKVLRTILSWSHDQESFGWEIRQSMIWHELNFRDPDKETNSTSTFFTFNQHVEGEYQWSDILTSSFGLIYKIEQSHGDALGDPGPNRNTLALFHGLRLTSIDRRWNSAFNLRQELVDGKVNPTTLSLGADFMPFEHLSFRANASRNYRMPTFNDMYWMGEGGLGNPDLVAELSWSTEVGASWSPFYENTKSVELTATAFSSWVDNWILWRPVSVDLWTPYNVKKVWSRGMETSISGKANWNGIKIDTRLDYVYVLSMNDELTDKVNARELDNQLIYTPEHEMSMLLKLDYAANLLMLNYTYTGLQYTDGENSDVFALPAYQVWNVSLNRSINFGRMAANLRFEANNLLDESYENRRGYPMYGRNYTLGIKLNFNDQINE